MIRELTFPARARMRSWRLDAAVFDGIVISTVVLASALTYLTHVGFYADDWIFLGGLATTHDQSFLGLISGLLPQIATRPVQALYLAMMYGLFATNPIGYQAVALMLLAAGGVLAYFAARQFGLSRAVAMIAAVIYATLPNYSTDRLWVAAAQALVSMVLFFLSVYALGRASTAGPRWVAWLGLSTLAVLVGALSYEVFLPLCILVAVALPLIAKAPTRRRPVLMALNPLIVVLVSIFKFEFTARIGASDLNSRLHWLSHLVKSTLLINFGDYGVGLPLVAAKLWLRNPSWAALAVAALAGMLVFGWVMRLGADSHDRPLRIAIGGAVFFAGGYAIFLTNNAALLTPTGIGNRVSIAATYGMALLFAAGAVWLAQRITKPAARSVVLAVVAALVVGSGVLVNDALAEYWHQAAVQQSLVLSDLKQDAPALPSTSTVLLDGFCPYAGPAVVFEAMDVTGALQILYSAPGMSGDVVTSRMSVTASGLHVYGYGQSEWVHPFNDALFVYDHASRSIWPLRTETEARIYFAAHPTLQCAGSPGYGASVI